MISKPSLIMQSVDSSPISEITIRGGAIDTDQGIKIISSPRGGGMGSYLVHFSSNALSLTLEPQSELKGTYVTTIEVNLSIGP
ncbi:hypothetical protein J2S74_003801 [Evansella vedderi]|uniref:Uncharacterized protein n=1 Tax=Evansella vedderi TaxID=38282 RepID=A0ABT9ZYQ2_9BACI|nr:hypothetical protein [Evansella vedderi]MDQ0256381.1 hypothetical protein [Evansella vedderi]